MFLVMRTVVYATLFIGLLLIYLPSRVLAWSQIAAPQAIGPAQVAGMALATLGAALALWCVASFVRFGHGTPAPFDAPRQLVIRGPYRFVRNPMYLGAGLALAGAALYYKSGSLLIYACAFLLVFHLFVVFYEERTLRRSFGASYETYCHHVRRWWPTLPSVKQSVQRPATR